ncbi:glycosyltransferase family 20 protein [Mycena olivaceomarginata]|nr:glycosyltransferase family 20 protein [Mycena olivaceomarginata]
MNSFRNQRIVIASLFLPSTAVVGTGPPIATPEIRSPSFSVPDVLQRVESAIRAPHRPALRKGSNPPAKSIVDDLINCQRQTAHSDHRVRAQRKPSRSSSRRPESELSIRDEWHVEHNPHCNGGLKKRYFGSHTDSFSEPLRHAVDKKMLVEQACVPVWIPDAEFESCYDEFCHQVLWPPKCFYESASFKQYVADGDIIWVNDYHLMLLPAMLRASPRSPLMPHCRIMAYEALPRGIQCSPWAIDVQQLEEKKREPDVAEWVQVLKQRYVGMKLVVGRDKLDEIQGVRHKLLAFQTFLEKHPEFQQKVVLIQVALQTTSSDVAGSIADIVTHINSRFSTLTYQPVVFLPTQDLTFSQYLALLTVADAFLVTSLREGMALRTHEFVECQEGRHRPLILSEFTGSYSYSGFRSCIAINPWDTRGTAAAINQALTMSDDEALRAVEGPAQPRHDTDGAGVRDDVPLAVPPLAHGAAPASHEAAPMLDMHRVLPRYKHSSKRLLLMDLEGTLWARPRAGPWGQVLRRFAADGRNDVWLLSGLPIAGVLSRIAKEGAAHWDCGGERVCMGGRRNGAELSPVNTVATLPGGWINMVATFNLTWKSSCVEILNYFTERTPGSFVEEREASIVWRFWTGETSKDCGDRQWALRQAAEAQNHIFDSLGERYGLRIIPGDNSFLTMLSRSAGWMSHDTDEDAAGDLDLVARLRHGRDGGHGGKATDAKWRLDADRCSKRWGVFASVGV